MKYKKKDIFLTFWNKKTLLKFFYLFFNVPL